MKLSEAFREYVRYLFAGRRAEAREVMMRAHDRGLHAGKLLKKVVWLAMEEVERLYREDHISRIQEHMATRINRMVADQLQGYLARKPKTGQRIIVTCGDGEVEELGAQITADLFEERGWMVWFLGSGVPNDEILQLVGKVKPDVLCVYGAKPAGVPNVKKLVELIRGVGLCNDMQILVTGGVFNRAEGLAEEIKADLFAQGVEEALKTVADHPVRVPKPDVPQPGRRRKRKPKPSHAAAIRKAKIAMGA
ncbi:MAG: cobalamin B12-binding domain-containing protein [Planctomycetota bacterium]|jgi:methanogenic corrinoid protein MtbC1